MAARSLFATRLYEADIGGGVLLAELAHSIRSLAEDDEAGRRWSKEHGYAGYTSYASLDDLPKRDPAFRTLAGRLSRHARGFARDLGWEVKPKLDSLWVNQLGAEATTLATSTRTASYPERSTSKFRQGPARSVSRTRACR